MTMKSAVRPPRPSSISQKIDDATRQARFRSPFTSRSLKTGTNAADSAESATSDRTVFGIRKAISNALIGPLMPKIAACAISRTSPMTREIPVAIAKMTPERARPRPTSASGSGRLGCNRRSKGRGLRGLPLLVERLRLELDQLVAVGVAARTEDRGRTLGGVLRDRPGVERRVALEVRRLALLAPAAVALKPPLLPLPLGVLHEGSIGSGVATIARPASCGSFSEMPNIKQQEKRVRQAARQRQENLRWRSTAKTLMRRLNEAVADGDAKETEARHRELVQWLDRAAANGALHRNTVARRKSQAAKLAAGTAAK